MLGTIRTVLRGRARWLTVAWVSGVGLGASTGAALAGSTSPLNGAVTQHLKAKAGRCGPAKNSTVFGTGMADLKGFGRAVATTSNCNGQTLVKAGRFLLTFKDGSTVRGTFQGTLKIGSAVGMITETLTVAGGTKRFARASGSGSVVGTEDLKTFVSKVQITGSIAYGD